MDMIGFIGAGNMATALMQGMMRGGVSAAELVAYDLSSVRMDAMKEMGIRTVGSALELAELSQTTVIAVKPKHVGALLDDLNAFANVRDVLSIATGWTQAMLEAALPKATGIARAMPNTPVQVGEGMIVLNENHSLPPERFDALRAALSSCGRVAVVAEPLFDAVTAISGSGPAYVYVFIEALADAGVLNGLPRELAYTLAAQTVLGAGKTVLETGAHPGALKDAVTSPGGTTIEAIYALEKSAFRGAVMQAVDACAEKSARMTKS